jgi:hypothetical protein
MRMLAAIVDNYRRELANLGRQFVELRAGLHHAMILTRLQTRLLRPGLAQLTDPDPPSPSTLRTAARNYQRALDHHTQKAGFAA